MDYEGGWNGIGVRYVKGKGTCSPPPPPFFSPSSPPHLQISKDLPCEGHRHVQALKHEVGGCAMSQVPAEGGGKGRFGYRQGGEGGRVGSSHGLGNCAGEGEVGRGGYRRTGRRKRGRWEIPKHPRNPGRPVLCPPLPHPPPHLTYDGLAAPTGSPPHTHPCHPPDGFPARANNAILVSGEVV